MINDEKTQANVPKDPMVMGEKVTEKVPVAGVKTPVINPGAVPPVVNPMATPQPSDILSKEKVSQMSELAKDAPTTAVRVKPDALPTSEVRVEVPPGMEHLADESGQIAYATLVVNDKTIVKPALAEPMGSRRLADEQAAGRAALVRKHGPDQLKREQAQGAASAARKT